MLSLITMSSYVFLMDDTGQWNNFISIFVSERKRYLHPNVIYASFWRPLLKQIWTFWPHYRQTGLSQKGQLLHWTKEHVSPWRAKTTQIETHDSIKELKQKIWCHICCLDRSVVATVYPIWSGGSSRSQLKRFPAQSALICFMHGKYLMVSNKGVSEHAVHSTASWTRSEGLWKGPIFPFTAGW